MEIFRIVSGYRYLSVLFTDNVANTGWCFLYKFVKNKTRYTEPDFPFHPQLLYLKSPIAVVQRFGAGDG
jgi:hypothetical protein